MTASRPLRAQLLVRNTLANGLAQAVQVLSAFVFMPLLIASFGMEGYGVYLLAASLVGFLGLLDMGVGNAIVKFVAEYRTRADHDGLESLISSTLGFFLVIGCLASVLCVVLAWFVLPFFHLSQNDLSVGRQLLYASALVSLLVWPGSVPGFVLAGSERYDVLATLSACAALLSAATTALVVLLGGGPLILLCGISAVRVLQQLSHIWFAKRELPSIRVRLRSGSLEALRKIARFSGDVFVAQLSYMLYFQQADRLVLGLFVGPSAIALYEAPSKLQAAVKQLSELAGSAVVPAASRLSSAGSDAGLKQLYIRGTRLAAGVILPVTVILIVLAGPLVRSWLGPSYAGMVLPAQLFVSFWLLHAHNPVSASVLVGIGDTRFIRRYSLAVALCNVVLSCLLAPILGVTGVILGTIVPFYVGFFVWTHHTLKALDIPFGAWFGDIALRTYPFLLAPILLSLIGVASGLANSLIGVLCTGAVSFVTYWALFVPFGLTPDDRSKLLGVLPIPMRNRIEPLPIEGPE